MEKILNQKIKKIDISEFRKLGYLQEVNRRFFHPLGLALEVVINDNNETLGGIWDFRDDPEGIRYDYAHSNNERKKNAKQKKEFIDNEIKKRFQKRKELLGFDIEPIE